MALIGKSLPNRVTLSLRSEWPVANLSTPKGESKFRGPSLPLNSQGQTAVLFVGGTLSGSDSRFQEVGKAPGAPRETSRAQGSSWDSTVCDNCLPLRWICTCCTFMLLALNSAAQSERTLPATHTGWGPLGLPGFWVSPGATKSWRTENSTAGSSQMN